MRNSIVAFAVLVALTGCGDDGSSSPESGDKAPVSLPGTTNAHGTGDATSGTLAMEMDDFYFGPTFVKATPGANVTLNLKNEGAQNHTFTTFEPKFDVVVTAGGTGVAAVTMPQSGALLFYCRFHQQQGMQGALFSQEGDTVGPRGTTSPSGDGGSEPYGQ